MIVAMKHEKRRFVGDVDFITSPGWLEGPAHARRGGPAARAACGASSPISRILGFDEDTREMKVLALHPGVTREQVQDNTGFKLLFDKKVETAEPPRKDELAVLRDLDPERLYTACTGLMPSAGSSDARPDAMLAQVCPSSPNPLAASADTR